MHQVSLCFSPLVLSLPLPPLGPMNRSGSDLTLPERKKARTLVSTESWTSADSRTLGSQDTASAGPPTPTSSSAIPEHSRDGEDVTRITDSHDTDNAAQSTMTNSSLNPMQSNDGADVTRNTDNSLNPCALVGHDGVDETMTAIMLPDIDADEYDDASSGGDNIVENCFSDLE